MTTEKTELARRLYDRLLQLETRPGLSRAGQRAMTDARQALYVAIERLEGLSGAILGNDNLRGNDVAEMMRLEERKEAEILLDERMAEADSMEREWR